MELRKWWWQDNQENGLLVKQGGSGGGGDTYGTGSYTGTTVSPDSLTPATQGYPGGGHNQTSGVWWWLTARKHQWRRSWW